MRIIKSLATLICFLAMAQFAQAKELLPPGPWSDSCDSSQTLRKSWSLISRCEPSFHPTEMNLYYCGSGVENHGGLLVCKGYSTYPRGSFLNTVVRSKNIGTGNWEITTVQDDKTTQVKNIIYVSHCRSKTYANVKGLLMCEGQWSLTGPFLDSCSDLTVNQKVRTIAGACKNNAGAKVAVNFDYTNCIGYEVINNNGVLKCDSDHTYAE